MTGDGRRARVLIAGVGNAWMRDDGFGGEVARRLAERELPSDAAVMDAGTGGLDLAYEVMRGYDALVLLDISRQGGEPGTLYVMEPDEDTVHAGIEDGDAINPHGMDPETVLRFVRSLGAWPGRVIVIACEPAEVEVVGLGLSEQVGAAVDAAVELAVNTVHAQPAPRRRGEHVHELSLSSAIVNTVEKHAHGRPVAIVHLRVGLLRQVVPDTLELYFEFVARGSVCEGARLEQQRIEATLRCEGCGYEWEIEIPAFRCPACSGAEVRVATGQEFEVESIEIEEVACIAPR